MELEFSTISYAFSLIGILLGLSLILGRLLEKIHIQRITGFILAGVIVGVGLILLDKREFANYLEPISSIALAFIGFEIGTRLNFHLIKHAAVEVMIITLFQVIFGLIIVFGSSYLFGASISLSIVLAVIALTTSPATFLVISRKYKTKGELTDAVMPHLGFDDVVSVILFSIALAFVGFQEGTYIMSVDTLVFKPFLELSLSIIAGGVIGLLLSLVANVINKKKDNDGIFVLEVILAITFIIALTSFEIILPTFKFKLSGILTPLVAGVIFTNLVDKKVRKETDEQIDKFTPVFISLFFASIGVTVITTLNKDMNYILVLILTISYIISRIIGKVLGSIVGGRVAKAPNKVSNYLGLVLIPQASVSIVLAKEACEVLNKTDGELCLVIVLVAAIVFELIGPTITKTFLRKSDESKLFVEEMINKNTLDVE